MANSAAFAALDAHIARVRALPGKLEGAAPDVAEALRGEVSRQLAAGTDPDGRPLPRTKDGRKPLTSARVFVGAVGSRILLRIDRHIARHHLGRAKGGIVRRLIPTKEIPTRYAQAIKRVLERTFQDSMNG